MWADILKPLEWFKDWRVDVLLVICLISGVTIFLPAAWMPSGVGVFLSNHLVVEWFAFAGSGGLLLVRGIHVGGAKAIQALRLRAHLRALTADEKKILKRFADLNASTLPFLAGDTGTDSLLADGIISRAEDSHGYFQHKGFFYYTLRRDLRDKIKRLS
jgi:hypothetical protein